MSQRNLPMRPPPPGRPVTHPDAGSRLPVQRGRYRGRDLLLDLPIAWRLALGFVLAAVIAAVAATVPALQRSQSLTRESGFYESLLRSNTSLTTGDSFLQLMNGKLHTTLTDATAANASKEDVAADVGAVQALADRYDTILAAFTSDDLVATHDDQVSLLEEAGHGVQVAQQRSLAASARRTWQTYADAQKQILQSVSAGDLDGAARLLRSQGEPTNADAQSALRALIQLNGHLAKSVRDSAEVEQQSQTFTTLIAALLAILAIGGVGWVISKTVVDRLRRLYRVTDAVEQGEMGARVEIVGRDEVARVSSSVNGMLDTIVGLLDVTRRQRDALTNAAERLFSDIRVAGAGDLRVSASVSSDPIGMLGNAFNFTIGRFRRFVIRTQSTVDQLDVIARQQTDRAEAYLMATQQFLRLPDAGGHSMPEGTLGAGGSGGLGGAASRRWTPPAAQRELDEVRQIARRIAVEGGNEPARAVLNLAEQAYHTAGRLGQGLMQQWAERNGGVREDLLRGQIEEVRRLAAQLTQLGSVAHGLQTNAAGDLARIETALDRAATGLARAAANSTPSTPEVGGGVPVEVVRLSAGFAQDVAALARQVVIVTQDLRASLAPFRLDTSEGADALERPMLAGSGRMADYEQPPYGMDTPSMPGYRQGPDTGYPQNPPYGPPAPNGPYGRQSGDLRPGQRGPYPQR